MKRKSFWYFIISMILFLCVLFLLEFHFVENIDVYSENIQNIFSYPIYKNIFMVITNIMSVIGILIILIATIYILRNKNAKKDIILYIAAILICLLLTNIIKMIVRRSRPLNMLLEVSGFSFPSSHASISMVVYGFLILLIRKYYQGKRKNFYILLCILMILLTGISRIYFNVHYVTDVIAGFSLGFMVLSISNFIMKKGINS